MPSEAPRNAIEPSGFAQTGKEKHRGVGPNLKRNLAKKRRPLQRAAGRPALSVLKQILNREADILGNLTQKNRREVSSRMKRHGCAPPILVPKLLVRPSLTHLNEAKLF